MVSQQREPGLDLIRAGAIAAVLVYHMVNTTLFVHDVRTPGIYTCLGGAGVSAFFALSGFLIGRMLLKLCEAPTVSAWWTFMLRRWGRTMPLYAAVMVGICLTVPPVASSAQASVDIIIRQFLLVQVMAPSPTAAYINGLSHTWSLAVEEWFYLTFSVILIGGCRIFGRRAVLPVIAAFIILPVIARMVGWHSSGYSSTPENFDGIACGVALAAIERVFGISRISAIPAMIAGVSLITAAWMMNAMGIEIENMPFWTPVTSALGFCLIIVASLHIKNLGYGRHIIKVLSEQSYGLYLIHLPVLDGCRWLMNNGYLEFPAAAVLFLFATSLLVLAGHRWIEVPGMKIRPRQIYGTKSVNVQ